MVLQHIEVGCSGDGADEAGVSFSRAIEPSKDGWRRRSELSVAPMPPRKLAKRELNENAA
jgi:hypothetical protein